MSVNTLFFGHNDREHNPQRHKPDVKNSAVSVQRPGGHDSLVKPGRVFLTVTLSNSGKEAIHDVCVDVFAVGGFLPDGDDNLNASILRNITIDGRTVATFENLTIPGTESGTAQWTSPCIEWAPSIDHQRYCIALARAYRIVNGQTTLQPTIPNPASDFLVAVRRFLLKG